MRSVTRLDEIGYLPVTQSGAILFFQLINQRYGRASTVPTSNKQRRRKNGTVPFSFGPRQPARLLETDFES